MLQAMTHKMLSHMSVTQALHRRTAHSRPAQTSSTATRQTVAQMNATCLLLLQKAHHVDQRRSVTSKRSSVMSRLQC